ncbi:MAG: XcyI family restriction endonuclease [Deltaproteobacteria bacterium]|nr:XcyI family restriction endonuclease [Deltaproteobacteria bacterium]
MKPTSIRIPSPDLQIDFSIALAQIRQECLQEALCETIKNMDIAELDRELADVVPRTELALLASRGLRGELLFPVPCLLIRNPKLIGYYRLLYGFSQKAFYSADFGLSIFKSMEDRGMISKSGIGSILPLCRALAGCASSLLKGIGEARLTKEFMDDLTLLTLGPQLRGGANVRKGTAGIVKIFDAITGIVQESVVSSDCQCIEIKNAAGRRVLIEFASDPDIIIREVMAEKRYRNIIAMEIKGGTDFSNIHNRIGEAEKSHQKARQKGYVECWTIVNVDKIDLNMAHKESPSTNRFYRISHITSGEGREFDDFKNRIVALTGIPTY